jgi:hypothetical protein
LTRVPTFATGFRPRVASSEPGELGESLAARVVTDLQGDALVKQHSPGVDPGGTDLVTLDSDGRVAVTEVTTTAPREWWPPSTHQDRDTHQMDREKTSSQVTRDGCEVEVAGSAFDDLDDD